MAAPSRQKEEEERLFFDDNQLAQQLYGPQSEHLRRIEESLGIHLNVRGNRVSISGELHASRLAKRVLEQLYKLLQRGYPIYPEDVDRALRILSADEDTELSEVVSESLAIPALKKEITARSQHQRSYLEAMRQNDLVFSIGPAGTGKTYLAVAMATQQLQAKKVSRIILSRPAVEAGEKLGFLPGDIAQKINPYLRPLYDALYDMMDHEKVIHLMETGVIEIAPLAFMRGRTLNSSFIILDEAQNCTVEQMKMFLTRIGFDSRVVVAGDVTQIDLPDKRASGLIDAERRLKNIPGIAFQHFDESDVVRHELVSQIVKAYEGKDRT